MYKDLKDEEILDLYKGGDEQALDFLIAKYKALASKIARSYFLIGAESEDLLQEAMIGLYSACRNYQKNQGASFKTFATLCINRAVQSAVKIANRLKNRIINDSYSLTSQGAIKKDDTNNDDDDLYIYIPSTELEPEDALLANEREKEISKFIEENLSAKEKEVFKLYLNGLSYSEIAGRLNQSTKSIDNAISRTKKKLEKALK
ncbi:MAG: sigma-70 family RNA polymerase sigma factor [Clostridia bacterium]|nr:sigma-70 family RNA polymerase sigma factor [Clostridia bacterium]